MKLIFKTLFFFCNFIFVCTILFAQTKFYASATPSKAGLEELITYTLTVENGVSVEQINHPEFINFITVSGPNQFSSQTNRNGIVTQSVSLSYILQPKKAGNFQIAASTAIIEGKTYKSNTVSISISNKKSLNKNPKANNQSPFAAFDLFGEPKPKKRYDDYILRNGETVQENVSRNMQLRLQTDKTSCYVGEPLLATYKLFTRLQSESNVSKNPSFNGFSVIDMMDQEQSPNNHESINGREYNVYAVRQSQLYPLQSGAIELEPATLDNKITFVKNENGNNTMFEENVSLTSNPLTIQVKPLPEAGKPENFKEAVGNFSIEASVEKNKFSTDETGKLLITISGKGNMQLLTIPEINWPTKFEVYEPKIIDNLDNTTMPISGTKIFEIPFTIADSGSHTIPVIKLSFFDPATRSYKMASTKNILLKISKGKGVSTSSVGLPIKKAKPVSLLNKIFASRWLVILLLAAIIFIAFIFWIGKEKKKEEKIMPEEIKKEEAKVDIPVDLSTNINYLVKTEDCLTKNDCIDFYSLLSIELKQFLAKRFSINKENINSKTLVSIMDKKNIDNNISVQTQQLFEEIEWQLYTPFERSEKLQDMYARAQTLIQILSKP
jgi:hypothetical protein